jgi:hypothetical protein
VTATATMTRHALDAVSLVPRERVCGHNGTAKGDDKIIDVDVFVAGRKRGTWRRGSNGKSYGMYLELLKRDGSMEWALPYGGGYCDDAEQLKPATAELLIAGQLPDRRHYIERRVIHFLLDHRYAIVATPILIGLLYWLLIR